MDLLQSSVFGGGVQKRFQGFQGLTNAHKLEKLTLQQILLDEVVELGRDHDEAALVIETLGQHGVRELNLL